MTPATAGAVAGLLGSAGLLLTASGLRRRRTTLEDRLAPYLRPRPVVSALLAPVAAVHGPWATWERLAAPVLADLGRLVGRLGSPTADLRRRLARAGRASSVEEHRAGQVVAGALGLAAGLLLALVLVTVRGAPVGAVVVLVVLSGVGAMLVPDWLLGRRVRVREARIVVELPTVAELLALAVSAGEGPLGALERVVRTTSGVLSAELARTLADVRSGLPLVSALDRLADRTGVAALTRFAEAVAVAVERGTPLADVLRAQAQDVREQGRRALLEQGGRTEVLMLVPVVFLLLPLAVVFAVFPSMVVLRVGL